ncbi:hypothetical protein [Pseudoalteromonas sp. T1lg21]|uniref:hypothetical protein n=1 Tax=Pseudoalteromonas sp. T1lg21 TaxID=2077095 RepID=UPI000CF711A1|nr:hypothetical protein [Pseudoalteromonas sp. T1lg21]
MFYSLRARRAIRKNLTGIYEDRPITVEEVDNLWIQLRETRIPRYRFIELINQNQLNKEGLQLVFDALNLYDIA